MRRDVDPQLDPRFEAVVRHELTRLIDAIETTPADEAAFEAPALLSRTRARATARRRRTLALAATSVAAAAAAVLAFVVLPGDGRDDENDVTIGGGRTTTTTSSTTTTTPSTSTAPTTTATAPTSPDDVVGSNCPPDVADDGLVSSGTLTGDRRWEYRVTGELPAVQAQVLVDGSPASDGSLAAESQQEALAPDRLVWGHTVRIDGGEIADFVVPAAATRVVAYVWDGAERRTVDVCTRGLPDVDELRYAAMFTPSGSEVIAVVAADPDGTPVAHTDLVAIPDQGGPEAMAEVESGDLPSGRWSLRVGGDSELLAVQLDLPSANGEGGGAAVRSRPELLRDTWYASSVWDGAEGRYFLWGFTREDVTEVVVTLYDDQVVQIPTVSPGGTGAAGRVFVGEFTAGSGIRLIEGHRADGSVAVELPEPENGSIGNGMPEQANVRLPMREVG